MVFVKSHQLSKWCKEYEQKASQVCDAQSAKKFNGRSPVTVVENVLPAILAAVERGEAQITYGLGQNRKSGQAYYFFVGSEEAALDRTIN